MSDTEEESSGSDSQWPVNESWLRGLLQRNHPADADNINILVSEAMLACLDLAATATHCSFVVYITCMRFRVIDRSSIATNTCRTSA